MRNLYFLIPASPTAAFFSQIAMFDLAIQRRVWRSFKPRVIAIFGGTPDNASYQPWQPHLSRVEQVFLPTSAEAEKGYMRQIDWRFRAVPSNADIAVLCDADTLVVGDIERAAEEIIRDRCVAGVIAHHHFPGQSQIPVQDQWNRISTALIGRSMPMCFTYSLLRDNAPIGQRVAPFYLNFGAVFIAGSVLDCVAHRYLDLRPKVSTAMEASYMSAQIALALAVEAENAPKRALGMAYNFPNDPIADEQYPEELSDVRVIHYLRETHFRRGLIFASREEFARFLALDLRGSNRVFQSFVRRLTDGTYPFEGIN